MKPLTSLYILLFFIGITMLACEKDPVVPNEEELITTLTYTLVPVGGGDTVIFKFRDLDGDGGQVPTITTGAVTANTVYNASVELLNETENPVGNITDEVHDEAVDHQFFYSFHDVTASIVYKDTDANQHPVGIVTELATGPAGTGHITITLRHQPDKFASGVSGGDITNAGGETDIEVEFPFVIQ